eukprot:scaffold612299_cov46-Prasinocladus_malaysianus.AAC.2
MADYMTSWRDWLPPPDHLTVKSPNEFIRTEALFFAGFVLVVSIHTYALGLVEQANVLSRRVNPQLSVSGLLTLSDQASQKRFWRHMARTSSRWRNWWGLAWLRPSRLYTAFGDKS